jgi:hypothetical protein
MFYADRQTGRHDEANSRPSEFVNSPNTPNLYGHA